jgi:hypothetical protein
VYVTGGPGNSGGTTPYIVNFLVSGALSNNPAQLTGANGTTPLTGGGAAITITTLGSDPTGLPVKLSATVDVIIDVDKVDNRKALARHSSIGQYIVSAANASTGAGVALPSDT